MNEIEYLEAVHTAACCAYTDADCGVQAAREAANAADAADAADALDAFGVVAAAVTARVHACTNMFSTARALDAARDYQKSD